MAQPAGSLRIPLADCAGSSTAEVKGGPQAEAGGAAQGPSPSQSPRPSSSHLMDKGGSGVVSPGHFSREEAGHGVGKVGLSRGRTGFSLDVKGNLGWGLPIVNTFVPSANLPLKRETGPQVPSPKPKKLLDEQYPPAIA